MSKDSPRVGVYLRCSTAEQTTESQRYELEKYAAGRGWQTLAFYEDKGATGTNTNRSQLKQLLGDVSAGKLDLVLCWKLDRIARSLKDLISILHEIGEAGVAFTSLKDNLDLSTSTGRLMFHIVGAFAQFEAEILKERVRAGLANARAKGTRLGRPRQVDTGAALKLREAGLSLKAIARRLGCSKSAVHKTLTATASTKASIKRETVEGGN